MKSCDIDYEEKYKNVMNDINILFGNNYFNHRRRTYLMKYGIGTYIIKTIRRNYGNINGLHKIGLYCYNNIIISRDHPNDLLLSTDRQRLILT